jgi:hypothetical protein
MTDVLDEFLYEWDPLDYTEFKLWEIMLDVQQCCYLIQQIKCLLKNSDLYEE